MVARVREGGPGLEDALVAANEAAASAEALLDEVRAGAEARARRVADAERASERAAKNAEVARRRVGEAETRAKAAEARAKAEKKALGEARERAEARRGEAAKRKVARRDASASGSASRSASGSAFEARFRDVDDAETEALSEKFAAAQRDARGKVDASAREGKEDDAEREEDGA